MTGSAATSEKRAGQVRQATCPACSTPLSSPLGDTCGCCGTRLDAPRPATASNAAPAPRTQRLNPAQQAAVETNGHCLITACPGSGKTFVLRERAIRKLKQQPRSRGIAVTFTRDAARELEARVLAAYPEGAHRLICGTFHSLCKRQLEEANIKVNLVTEVQQADLVKRAWDDIMRGDNGITVEQARYFIDAAKSSLRDVTENPAINVLSAIYHRYQELLRQIGAMDFADMLVMTTKGMLTGKVPLLDGVFLLVDEAQDSDPSQMGWVNAYLTRGVEVTVVGDDDQSIYSWRFGLGFAGLDDFRHRAKATHISLDTTYRCAREILAPAGRLIQHNKERVAKSLRTENIQRGQVRRVVARNREDEIETLIETIIASGRPGSWGVLARTNRLIEQVERGAAGRIATTRSGGKSFWDLRWPSTYLALCRSVCFDDLVGVDAVLRAAGVSEGRLSELHRRFESRNTGALSAFIAASDRSDDPEGQFRARAREWRVLLAKGKMELVAQGIGDYMKTRLTLVEPSVRKYDEALEAAHRVIDAAVKVLRGMRGGLGQRLNTLQREQTQEASDEEGGGDAVRLMTLHGSKGLEFENVWLLGCERGVIPAKGAPEEEERRLFYVGMTRAKQLLVLSHAVAGPSPFFEECGPLD